ncbi:MAG: sulfur carrier protein ThiS [Candidatus Gastranaerophilales bacterium]|nr:sulfur carrier protein ThiS [Candidatus Gastranaerophilales bacterium]
MNVILNGKNINIKENATILDLIEFANVKSKMFVVEKNKEIIYKENYCTILQENDGIEIVGFFGGG